MASEWDDLKLTAERTGSGAAVGVSPSRLLRLIAQAERAERLEKELLEWRNGVKAWIPLEWP